MMFPRRLFKILMVSFSALASTVLLLLFIGKGLAAPTNIAQPPGTSLKNILQGEQVISQTELVFLPLIAKPYFQKALGSVTMLGPTACTGATAGNCYSISVTCPNITNNINATIKVGSPLISTTIGTVMFFSGFYGSYYWDITSANTPAIITDVRTAGYQTVQVNWGSGWFLNPGTKAGMDGVACRPATVARWVYDTFHQASQSIPYCAAGHSNGATQVAYMLTHYGLGDIIDEAIFESGPNFTLLEHGCIYTQSSNNLYLPTADRGWVDRSFGIFSAGPCEEAHGVDPARKQAWKSDWQAASIASLQSLNFYPQTQASFLFGSLDISATRYQGQEYSNWLALSGTPFYTSTVLSGAGHSVTGIQAGKDWMTTQIINGCVLH